MSGRSRRFAGCRAFRRLDGKLEMIGLLHSVKMAPQAGDGVNAEVLFSEHSHCSMTSDRTCRVFLVER